MAVEARRFQARALAAMFGAGAVLGLLSVLVPHGAGMNSAGAAVTSSLGLPMCLALVVAGGRTPTWVVHGLLMTGGTMVSLGMVFGGEGPASVATAFFFVWVALYVSWFFRTRTAVAHVVFDAAVFAAVLVIEQTPGGPAVWLLVMGTASVVSAVVTLMHRELVRVANRDLLTGLPTRPVLEETFAREAARAARHGLPLCVLILDVDGLKMINDRDGHSAGDRILALGAQAWRSALRESDLLTRFGGDEFVAVLPNCSDSAADQLLARLQAATSIPHSAGIARWQPGDELADVLARADADLYRDKRLHYASAPIAKRTAPGQFSEGSMSAAVATGRLKR